MVYSPTEKNCPFSAQHGPPDVSMVVAMQLSSYRAVRDERSRPVTGAHVCPSWMMDLLQADGGSEVSAAVLQTLRALRFRQRRSAYFQGPWKGC